MRRLLSALIFVLPLFCSAQFAGINISYLYDGQFGNYWRNSRGFQLGVGMENIKLGASPLTLGYRYSFGLTQARYNTRVDDIEFDLPDSVGNRMGYAKVNYNKFTVGLEFDLGYQQWEFSVLEPYVTLGFRYQDYFSTLRYDLYEAVDCLCYSTTPKNLTDTRVLGFVTGGGLKLRAGEGFYFDFRANYYGGWGLQRKGKNPYLPDTDSFQINAAGEPAMNYSTRRYAHGMTFSVGIIFRLRLSGSNFHLFGNDDDNDTNRNYTSDDNKIDPPAEKPCEPVELKPKGRKEKDPPMK